ncbi:MAG: preprotein translocase subunit SecF, partial [Parcubacteria group bacterium Gr01-1014_107]
MVLAASLFLIIYYGLDLSIDFTGGSVLEVRFEKGDPGKAGVEQVTGSIENSSFTVRPLENGGYSIRSQSLGEKERTLILEKLNLEKEASVREEKFSSIGPTIGRELKRKAFYALLITLLAIVLYIAFAFRKVSKPVSSWIYGLTAIIALAHDIT